MNKDTTKKKEKIYTFIHPTKSGGTSVERYFRDHYNDYIVGIGHATKCTNNNNPIIIIRDVKSRFLSMFKYWKNGSVDSIFGKRDESWKKKYNNATLLDFINIMKNDKSLLYHKFTHKEHYFNTCHWIGNTDYKNIIVIKYDNDLNNKIQKLLNLLDIPNKNIVLPIINKSNSIDNKLCKANNKKVDEFIKTYFKDDFKLIETIEKKPGLFKLVI